MTMTVAVLQFSPTEDKAANLLTIEDLVRRAVDQGARLAVLPEYAVFTASEMDERFVVSAEPLGGPTVSRLNELSSDLGVALVAGVNETATQGRIHNTLVGIDGGEVRAVYRKVHLYDAFGFLESDRVVAADPVPPQTFEVEGFTVATQTCYDVRFPETTRILVDAGADIVALPAEWVPGPLKEYHWNTLVRSRAIENTVYLAAAGQCAPTGVGNSVILDPMGIALAGLGEVPGIAYAQIERARIDHVRQTNPALSMRRYRVVPDEGQE